MWGALIRVDAVRRRRVGHTSNAGKLWQGSATHQLLRVLAENPQRWMTCGEIAARLEQPRALGWSLRYAQKMHWVEVAGDPRNARYLRYRLTEAGRGMKTEAAG